MTHVSEIHWDTGIAHWEIEIISWDIGMTHVSEIHWDTEITHWYSGMIHVSGIQPGAKSPRSAAELL